MEKLSKDQLVEAINALKGKSINDIKIPRLKSNCEFLLGEKDKFMFEFELDRLVDIKEGKINNNLKQKFKDHNVNISDKSYLFNLENDKWLVRGSTDQYLIKKESNKISVYYKHFDIALQGVLDYRAYYKLDKHQLRELYFVFIDAKDASIKTNISMYLYEKKMLSYNLASDMDILTIFLSDANWMNRFKDEVKDKFKSVELHVYKGKKPFFLNKLRPSSTISTLSPTLTSQILSRIICEYNCYEVEEISSDLISEKILLGYSIIYDFIRLDEIRDFALLFKVDKLENSIYNDKEFKNCIIDLIELEYITESGFGAEDDYTTFYSEAKYIAFLEFSSSCEREMWEKMFGTIYKGANAFFFPISNIIYLGSYVDSDREFEERVKLYSNKKIDLGNPIYNEREYKDKSVGLDFEVINGHGAILGESHTGKSTTLLQLIDGFYRNKLFVYLFNPTSDVIEKLKRTYSNDINEYTINDFINSSKGFEYFAKKINTFSINQNDFNQNDIVSKIISSIRDMPQLNDHNGIRPLKYVLIIEEAHEFFAPPNSVVNIVNVQNLLETLTHYGFAFYLVTQKLAHLKNGDKSLLSSLNNFIFHRMTDGETKEVLNLLSKEGKDSLYQLEEEITSLKPGSVFIKFMDDNRGKSLLPLKVRINKK